MTTQLPGPVSPLEDFVAWRNYVVEEACDTADFDDAAVPSLANPFQITDLQHWIDLCA